MPEPPLPPVRVLVADDLADHVASMRLLLRGWGCDVRTAADGRAALAAALEFRPQVALLDVGMPGLSGPELARELKARPETAGCRLVAVTGYAQHEDMARAAGFDHFLVKPSDLAALRRILAEAAAGGPATA